jgi:hypothetical protein
MKNKTTSILVIALILLSVGCTTSNTNYYWGNYSGTLYNLKKNPGDDALNKHIEEMKEIISKSKDKNLRVPPGIHAELGYRLAEINEMDQARMQLNNESAIYPESKTFINRVAVLLGLD